MTRTRRVSASPRSMPAATTTLMTTSSKASTRSLKTRSSRGPIPPTGSASRFRLQVAGERFRSTGAAASSIRCARPRIRASPISSIRARRSQASAVISILRRIAGLGQCQPLVVCEHQSAASATQRRLDPQDRLAGTCRFPPYRGPRPRKMSSSAFRARCCRQVPASGICSTSAAMGGSFIPSSPMRSSRSDGQPAAHVLCNPPRSQEAFRLAGAAGCHSGPAERTLGLGRGDRAEGVTYPRAARPARPAWRHGGRAVGLCRQGQHRLRELPHEERSPHHAREPCGRAHLR